jgi:Fe-S cluster biogenesis protein NfuA
MTETSLAVLQEALQEVRAFVSADGADLELLDFDSAAPGVRLRLDVSRVACMDCIVPPAMLLELIQRQLRKRIDGLKVEVEDPRATTVVAHSETLDG